ncbi:MAG: HesA/MoeB/ThiF family protein [Promethearchaeota archaeon]
MIDRYTRLKALKDFGYDIEWEDFENYHVGVIGIGGLGTITSEMVVRCGIGKISLFDFDIVDSVNLNRSMFKPEDVGQSKVNVAKKVLNTINPDVKIYTYNEDIMDPKFESTFESCIQDFDIILNGLDNAPARAYLNIKCIKNRVPYIDAGASRSGLSGYIHPVIPYDTACSECINMISLGSSKERGESCVASLPSTMAILGSLQVQELLKYIFKFGKMIDYLMYNMLNGKFQEYSTVRDKKCSVCGIKKIKRGVSGKPKTSKKELNDLIEELREDRKN